MVPPFGVVDVYGDTKVPSSFSNIRFRLQSSPSYSKPSYYSFGSFAGLPSSL